jgi:multidrug transporter EmrE-like cation transporter
MYSDRVNTPIISYIYFVFAAILGAAGQYLYKSGADRTTDTIASYFNIRILGGVACYLGVMVLFIAAFKRGGQMQVLYPIYASTFIFAALLAWWAYDQPIRAVHVVGMCSLVFGMYLMGK